MLGLKKHKLFKIALWLASGISMLMTPLSIAGQENDNEIQTYHDCDEPSCPQQWGTKSTAILIGGALIAGGVAIATANSSWQKGHSGSTGPVGTQGPQLNFTADEGQSLTFNFDSLETLFSSADITTVANVTIIPFVVDPNGNVIEGTPVPQALVRNSTNPILSFGTIVIKDPVFGNYQGGVQMTFDTIRNGVNTPITITSVEYRLLLSILASRDNTTTFTTERDVSFAFTITINDGNKTQTSADYGYDPKNIP